MLGRDRRLFALSVWKKGQIEPKTGGNGSGGALRKKFFNIITIVHTRGIGKKFLFENPKKRLQN